MISLEHRCDIAGAHPLPSLPNIIDLASSIWSSGLFRGFIPRTIRVLPRQVVSSRVASSAANRTSPYERPLDLSNMHWDVRAVTTPSSDTDLSLLVTFDHAKYLFNCGEGTQRSFVQSRTSMRKLEGIYMTSANLDVIGGLPGKSYRNHALVSYR